MMYKGREAKDGSHPDYVRSLRGLHTVASQRQADEEAMRASTFVCTFVCLYAPLCVIISVITLGLNHLTTLIYVCIYVTMHLCLSIIGWIESQLSQKRGEYMDEMKLVILCGTWNVNAKKPPEDIKAWLVDKVCYIYILYILHILYIPYIP